MASDDLSVFSSPISTPYTAGRPASPGSLGKPDRPVEPVMIGYRQCLITQLDCPFHQILGVGRPIEKGEVGVAMQLGILAARRTFHRSDYIEHMFDVR